ncbi:MAG: hypothetical protein MJ064_08770, partial [Lachnospiraceae bacterium]|nr:hypothetical protein [Lachnospiraceae bacterium]
ATERTQSGREGEDNHRRGGRRPSGRRAGARARTIIEEEDCRDRDMQTDKIVDGQNFIVLYNSLMKYAIMIGVIAISKMEG